MKRSTKAPLTVSLFITLLFLIFSCSKDSDLFNEYVLADTEEDIETISEGSDDSNQEEIPNTEDTDNIDDTNRTDSGPLKAFPSAEGYGKFASGGRGGRVIEVTNLNNSGNGSFRDAVSQSGARIVVFRVSGTINLTSSLQIANGDLTIAGETAPGDGICVKGASVAISSSNVIMRYMRFRAGKDSGDGIDALRILTSGGSIENIIVDHCSTSWGTDEVFSITAFSGGSIKNITVQNSIIAEGFGTGGMLFMNDVSRTSLFANLFSDMVDRAPHSSTCGTEFEMINNLIYKYYRPMNVTYEGKYDVIGNIWKSNSQVQPLDNTSTLRYITNNTNCPNGDPSLGEVYQEDNIRIGDNTGNSLTNGSWSNQDKGSRVFTDSYISPMSSGAVENYVLDDVGANIKLDDVDARIISEYRNSTGGHISNENQVGGYPHLNSETPYTDGDHDGMDDSWEASNGLNPNDGSDGKEDSDNDGYTNLEEFLHSLTENLQ